MLISIASRQAKLRVVLEASRWFALMRDTRPANNTLSRRYLSWMKQSPLHVEEMLRLQLINGALWRFRSQIVAARDMSRRNVQSVAEPTLHPRIAPSCAITTTVVVGLFGFLHEALGILEPPLRTLLATIGALALGVALTTKVTSTGGSRDNS